jgi:hypothetical protein
MAVTCIFGAIGFFGFGITLHNQLPWIVPYIFFCIIVFGLAFLNIVTYSYVTDCLRDHAPEAFASLSLSKVYEFGIRSPNWTYVRIELLDCALVYGSRTPQGVLDYWRDSCCRHVVYYSYVHIRQEGKKFDCPEENIQSDRVGIK